MLTCTSPSGRPVATSVTVPLIRPPCTKPKSIPVVVAPTLTPAPQAELDPRPRPPQCRVGGRAAGPTARATRARDVVVQLVEVPLRVRRARVVGPGGEAGGGRVDAGAVR